MENKKQPPIISPLRPLKQFPTRIVVLNLFAPVHDCVPVICHVTFQKVSQNFQYYDWNMEAFITLCSVLCDFYLVFVTMKLNV